jgi:plasmid maintenance system antidote protein VapI
MTKRIILTSGDILKEEYLKPLKISAYRLAKDIGVSSVLIGNILNCNNYYLHTNYPL